MINELDNFQIQFMLSLDKNHKKRHGDQIECYLYIRMDASIGQLHQVSHETD